MGVHIMVELSQTLHDLFAIDVDDAEIHHDFVLGGLAVPPKTVAAVTGMELKFRELAGLLLLQLGAACCSRGIFTPMHDFRG